MGVDSRLSGSDVFYNARKIMIYPFYQEIVYQDPATVFALFANQKGSVLLESAQLRPGCARYSFIAVDPFLTLISKNSTLFLNELELQANPFQCLSQELARFPLTCHPDMPPFQGGAAGFFAYDLYQHLEKIQSAQCDDMQFADMAIGFYDLVVGFDHELKRAWIFSSGYPCATKEERESRAQARCAWLAECFNRDRSVLPVNSKKAVSVSIQSNFTRAEYCDSVQKVKEAILAGDIFEANISQRFRALLPGHLSPFDLYYRLRELNPAPFSAYVNLGETVLVSASPERFLKLTDKQVETRPIKGTRSRGDTEASDLQLAQELLESEKDYAENVMIVDLLRNDLSRVCEDHSVQVPQLCGLESYATVHHLVSVVTGQLQQQLNAVDLLQATFPGGSITGAPKIRAMEIIAEIEPTRRGPYCGSIGYIGFNGDMDTSITIRTYAIKNNVVTFQAGGAVVVDSDPLTEYEETLTKANALKRALGGVFEQVMHDFAD